MTRIIEMPTVILMVSFAALSFFPHRSDVKRLR